MIERGLIEVRRTRRFQFKRYLFEPGLQQRRLQPGHREFAIRLRVRANETNRTAHDSASNRDAELVLRRCANIAQHLRNQLFQRDALAEDLRGQQGPARQKRLERLHQPPLRIGVQVVLNRLWTGPRLHGRASGLLMLFEVEHATKRLRQRARERECSQPRLAWNLWICNRDRTVRGSKIEPNTVMSTQVTNLTSYGTGSRWQSRSPRQIQPVPTSGARVHRRPSPSKTRPARSP